MHAVKAYLLNGLTEKNVTGFNQTPKQAYFSLIISYH